MTFLRLGINQQQAGYDYPFLNIHTQDGNILRSLLENIKLYTYRFDLVTLPLRLTFVKYTGKNLFVTIKDKNQRIFLSNAYNEDKQTNFQNNTDYIAPTQTNFEMVWNEQIVNKIWILQSIPETTTDLPYMTYGHYGEFYTKDVSLWNKPMLQINMSNDDITKRLKDGLYFSDVLIDWRTLTPSPPQLNALQAMND